MLVSFHERYERKLIGHLLALSLTFCSLTQLVDHSLVGRLLVPLLSQSIARSLIWGGINVGVGGTTVGVGGMAVCVGSSVMGGGSR